MTHPREEEFAFVRAILDDFDNPTPRLVFADWLEERHKEDHCKACDGEGEIITSHRADCNHCDGTGHVSNGFRNRAEFIRTAIAGLDDIVIGYINRNQLYRDHSIWDYNHPRFHLGFLDQVTLSPQQYHCHAALLCRLHPIRRLTISGWTNQEFTVFYRPHDRCYDFRFGKIGFSLGELLVAHSHPRYNATVRVEHLAIAEAIDYVQEHALQWAREILQP